MLVYFTWPTKKPGGHQSQLTVGQSLCLLSCNSSDTQRTDATLDKMQWQKRKIFIDSKLMIQEKGNNNKDQTDTKHPIHRTFTRHVTYIKTMRFKFVNQYQEGIF